MEIKKNNNNYLSSMPQAKCFSLICKWPSVQLVFVYVNLPPFGHCYVLTIQLIYHEAHREPDKTELNAEPALSGCGDIQTQVW